MKADNVDFSKSTLLLEQTEHIIPLGSQTFSKSRVNFPVGQAPLFVTHAEGCQIWDVDGNQYIDFINGLLSVTLGYQNPLVDKAVIQQLQKGVTFSLPHTLEREVAELIVELVPCAEMVRFGKNGTDATSAAIRLSRAYTGKDHIAVCGYHGWQDWYIGSTSRNLGVPKSTQELTHTFTYNDLDSLRRIFEEHNDQIAAVILEPMNTTEPSPGFLSGIRELCDKHGAVMVFDETITGFRFAKGGAQSLFNVIPDLATFGKGMSNGFPLSAVTGRKEIMKVMNDIFFSGTFGGETLSLAASKAVLEEIKADRVIPKLIETGQRILDEVNRLIQKHQVKWLQISGHPTWSLLAFSNTEHYSLWQIKTFFMQEMLKRGILIQASHNVSCAHTEADLDHLIVCYEEVLPLINEALKQQDLEDKLLTPPLEPLFAVR